MPTLADDAIIAAIEATVAIMPAVPERLTYVDFPSISLQARVTQIPHPFANNVSNAKLTGDVAAQVATVRDYYWLRNLPFSWTIGPITQPSDITTYFTEAGMEKGIEMAGLCYRDIAVPFPHDPTIVVREVPVGDEIGTGQIAAVAAEGFGMPLDLCHLFTASYQQTEKVKIRAYLAYPPNNDEPGAFAAAIYLPDSPIVVLSGAATLPNARGQGLYQALVARRFQDALADGMETAVIQAVRTTSAPILLKRGFVELCGLESWHGIPPTLREEPVPA